MAKIDRAWVPPVLVALLAAYPILYLAAQNPGQFQLSTVGVAVLASAVAFVVAWLVLSFVGGTRASAALGAAVLISMFYMYGSFVSWLDNFVLGLGLGDFATPNALDMNPNARHRLAIGWGLIALLVAILVTRAASGRGERLVHALTFAAVALCGFSIARIGLGLADGRSATQSDSRVVTAGSSGSQIERPDVFFVVLDGYARQDVLARYYDFDNGPFLAALRSRGFQVSMASSSNYTWTFLSIASTLNLNYLQPMMPGMLRPDSNDRSALYELIRDNAVARFLRQQGYEVVHVRSTWGATSVNPYADVEVRCETAGYANEFMRAVAESSWLGAFNTKGTVGLAQCNLANFDSLGRIGGRGRPKFVMAHFILPHHPYLFDRNGRILRDAVVSNQFEFQKRLWENRAGYLEQLQFVNAKMLQLVDQLLENNRARPPIIVIESDHGPGIIEGLSGPEHYAIRFANFGAYHLPGAPPDLMPSNGTAVNQFRRILGHYFGADLPPLPDLHFASPYSRPYAFREVPHDLLQNWWANMNSTAPAVPAGAQNVETGGSDD
jgi:hypothetical protein